ncbi:MAG: transcriptional repressor [Deltaproteobacteria bacterium]|nr:transcriptional repressor [Deltaproteobacteria bacterium]
MSSTRKNARNTRQLEVIWNVIKDDKSHPTADQIYDRVRKLIPKISLGTVYRNLQKLVADDRLQVLMHGRSQHFDPLLERHQHFICENCDRVYDIFFETPGAIDSATLPDQVFKVSSHQLALYGTCKNCSS